MRSKCVFQALFMEFGYLTVGKKIIAINNIKQAVRQLLPVIILSLHFKFKALFLLLFIEILDYRTAC